MGLISPGFPAVRPIEGTKERWLVLEDVHIDWNGYKFTVENGYDTDGASVPWWAWWFAPPMSPLYLGAAIGHDWVCDNREIMPSHDAHVMFYDLMLHLGLAKWRAKILYRAVLLGGPDW